MVAQGHQRALQAINLNLLFHLVSWGKNLTKNLIRAFKSDDQELNGLAQVKTSYVGRRLTPSAVHPSPLASKNHFKD
jgi:hypothetical protein